MIGAHERAGGEGVLNEDVFDMKAVFDTSVYISFTHTDCVRDNINGALLYTEDKDQFDIFRDGLEILKVEYV
jgi:hypothetical protein